MEDLLIALLEPLLEGLCEALFAWVAELLGAACGHLMRRAFVTFRVMPAPLAALLLVAAGALCGYGSALLLPHPLVPPSRLHGISVLISPPLVGLAMARLGLSLRYRNYRTVRLESFGYAYGFALAFSLVRFLLVRM